MSLTRTNQRGRSAAVYDRACKVLVGGVNSPVRAFGAVGGALGAGATTGNRLLRYRPAFLTALLTDTGCARKIVRCIGVQL